MFLRLKSPIDIKIIRQEHPSRENDWPWVFKRRQDSKSQNLLLLVRTFLGKKTQCNSVNFDCSYIFSVNLFCSDSILLSDLLVTAFSHLGGHQLCMWLNLNGWAFSDALHFLFTVCPLKNCIRFVRWKNDGYSLSFQGANQISKTFIVSKELPPLASL